MDIKDFILIGGGILIALVVAHGFWIALRAKRETLRMDIVPDLIPDDIDDIERFRGELPNGSARIRPATPEPAQQANLELDLPPPTLMDPVAGSPGLREVTAAEQSIAAQTTADSRAADVDAPRQGPVVHQAPPRVAAPVEPVLELNAASDEQMAADGDVTPANAPTDEAPRATVREVQIESERRKLQGPKNPALQRTLARRRERSAPPPPVRKAESEVKPADIGVEELLVLNVLAPKGTTFNGEDLVNVLRAEGLRYGDMNIFHRVDVATKAKVFSVANAVKPGTFDLADIENLCSPGMAMFMPLPGPEDPSAAFEDMLGVARSVQRMLGGDIRDENMSVLSGQTVEHMRQRIADYVRRRLSKRAQTLG